MRKPKEPLETTIKRLLDYQGERATAFLKQGVIGEPEHAWRVATLAKLQAALASAVKRKP